MIRTARRKGQKMNQVKHDQNPLGHSERIAPDPSAASWDSRVRLMLFSLTPLPPCDAGLPPVAETVAYGERLHRAICALVCCNGMDAPLLTGCTDENQPLTGLPGRWNVNPKVVF